MKKHLQSTSSRPPVNQPFNLWELPSLCTAEQVADALQCSSRTILNWSKGSSPKIPVALSAGKIIRFDPREVARALGIPAPGGAALGGANGQGPSAP